MVMYKKTGTSKIMNFLTLIDEGIKMVGYTWNFGVIIASMESQTLPLSELTGKTFCRVTYFVAVMASTSNIACGVGIAFIR